MIISLVIGLAFTAAAASLFARSLLFPRLYTERTLQQIGAYRLHETENEPTEAAGEPPRPLALRPAIDSLAVRLGGMSGGEERVHRLLLAAGLYAVSPRRFAGYQTLAAIGGGALWLLFVLGTGPTIAIATLAAAIAILGGWSAPMLILRQRARTRAQRIDYEMPELIDTLVTMIEAGLGFSAALQTASRRFRDSALGEELRLTLREQSMGLSLQEALDNMIERQGTVAVRSFVRSIVQAEQTGVSVGQTLRALASEMRARHRQQIEERAHKAPVKLVFPLVLFIFPSLFVIVLGPAALKLHEIF